MVDVLAIAGAARLVSKDVAEFEALVARQSHFVFRVAYAVLRNRHDAEDATQETFLKLYRNGTWKSMENERAFLSRAAWRIAVDRLPKSDRLPKTQAALADPESEIASASPTPEQYAIVASEHNTIHRMIDSLPEEFRQPLILSAIDELNSREIATILGLPEGTIRTRLMRARQILKQKMAAMLEKNHVR